MDGYEDTGSYRRNITYDISMEQIVAIINQSQRCEQFIKYECLRAGLWFDHNSNADSWWVSRHGEKMSYWGGAEPGSKSCACGMTNTCISQSWSKKCNCDQNEDFWAGDSGYLVDKSTLPVTELRFADTGGLNEGDEIGYHNSWKAAMLGLVNFVINYFTLFTHIVIPTYLSTIMMQNHSRNNTCYFK